MENILLNEDGSARDEQGGFNKTRPLGQEDQ
jgi:hypothetical protein